MKRFFLTAFALVTALMIQAAPLSGTFVIPSVDYPTITSAFIALNANGVSGATTFLVDQNYTETAVNLILTVPTAGASAPIVFKRDPAQTTGANPKITAAAGAATFTDGVIIIAGTDYVTFEKIDIDANAQSTVEWGYALVKRQNVAPFDGCQNVTINGCSINMNRTNTRSVGIYTGNHIATATTALVITSYSDACHNSMFDNNTITNAYLGFSLNGYAAPTPFSLYDHNNEIGQFGKNTITNFGGANTAAYGIYATNQDLIKIMNDSITGTAGSTNRLAGILLQSGTSSSGEIAHNYISVQNSTTGSSNTYGIWCLFGATPASNTVSIHHNTFKDCSSSTPTASAPLYGILNSGSPDTLRISDNAFYGFTLGTTGTQYVIRTEASANNVFISNNQIYNITNTGTGGITAIYNQSSVNSSIYGNNLYNINANGGGTVYGVYSALGTNLTIYRNNLYNMNSNNGSGASSIVYGIYNSTTPNLIAYNNFISDLKAGMATNNPSICGMYLNGGTASKVYYNTIFLNASSSGGTFGTAGIYASVTPTVDLRNNIICNNSVPGASGLTVAYRRSTNTFSSYSANSNNNCFYAGTPGTSNLIYYDVINSSQNLSDYQALVTPADAAAFSANPTFINSTSAPYNLHMQSGITTPFESGGVVISSPAIDVDYDGQARYPNSGYPDNSYFPATAPDVGADEFDGGPGAPPTKTLTLSLFLEGSYLGGGLMSAASDGSGPKYGTTIADQITVEIHDAATYATVVYTAPDVNLGTDGLATVTIPGAHNGSYYITIKHRNSIVTVSAVPISFAGSTISHSFVLPANVYSGNLHQFLDGSYGIYGGDVTLDGLVDGFDLSGVDNQAATFGSGYLTEDCNGDGLIDGTDLSIVDNNAAAFVGVAIP